MSPSARRWLTFLLALCGPLIVLLIWEALSRSELINPLFFPPPTSLEGKLRELLENGRLVDDVRISLGRILAGFNVQDRYNPKVKRSDRFDNPDDRNLVSWEDQTDTRDGQDYSGNVSYTADVGQTGRVSIDGFYVKTDREQVEVSHEEEYDGDEVVTSDVPGRVDVDQSNWGLGVGYAQDMAGGTTEFGIKYAASHPQHLLVREAFTRVRSLEDWQAVLAQWYADDLPGCYPDPALHRTGNCEEAA